jgi:hypothetical protein
LKKALDVIRTSSHGTCRAPTEQPTDVLKHSSDLTDMHAHVKKNNESEAAMEHSSTNAPPHFFVNMVCYGSELLIYMCMYVCVFACMHACMFVCMYVCMHASSSYTT